MSSSTFEDIAAGLRDAIAHAKGEDDRAVVHEVQVMDVAGVRAKLGLSQTAFAKAFGVSVATLRNWEQGRRVPHGPARVLLLVIDKEPDAVRRALETA